MPIQIANGPLGRSGRDVVIDYLDSTGLTTSRISALPADYLMQIGIPGTSEQKEREARIASEIADKYLNHHSAPHEVSRIEGKLMNLQAVLIRGFGTLDAVCGRTILDLACGSRVAGPGIYSNPAPTFEPWMCRLIHHLGGNAVGVDIRPQKNELFKWHQCDLEQTSPLDTIEDKSIDAYYSANFYPAHLRPVEKEFRAKWDQRDQRIGFALQRILKSEAIILAPDQIGVEALCSNIDDF